MDTGNPNRLILLGQIQDLIHESMLHTDPFLYYLPKLLTHEFSNLNIVKVLDFTRIAVREDRPPIVADALQILNKLIHHEDGSLKRPAPDIFYDNRNFNWNELGGHTQPIDVVSHIFNKTLFVTSVGKK